MYRQLRNGGSTALAAWLGAPDATAYLREDEPADRFDAAPALIGEHQSLSYLPLIPIATYPKLTQVDGGLFRRPLPPADWREGGTPRIRAPASLKEL
jgi:hypothetical protein